MSSIIEMKVSEHLDKFDQRVHSVFSDGIFPGTKSLPGPHDRLLMYLEWTPAVEDLPLLLDPDYVAKYQAGAAPPPQSPKWLQALSVPDTFRELQRDFIRLLGANRA